jgi:hypothetical protein
MSIRSYILDTLKLFFCIEVKDSDFSGLCWEESHGDRSVNSSCAGSTAYEVD